MRLTESASAFSTAASASAVVGQPAPAFTATDLAGKPVSLADFKGRTVVLEWHNFGCPFVQKHYRSGNMQALQKKYGKDVVWLAVNSTHKSASDYMAPAKLDAELTRFGAQPGQLQGFGREEWFAPMASGSNPGDAMVICPCTMGTLAAVAAGLADSLIERAADVMLKEKRKLILVPRETPMHLVQLRNLATCAEAGAVILPAMPAFYTRPQSLDDMINFVVGRICDQLGVEHRLAPRWGE